MIEAGMSRSIHFILAFAGASVLGCAALVGAGAEPANTLEIVVGNGPHAGTYKPADIMCMHSKPQGFAAAFKDFDSRDSKVPSQGGINVWNPEERALP